MFVLPRVFPHKEYAGASFAERLELIEAAVDQEGSVSLAIADAGLFIEIAHECRQAYGPHVRLTFLCGRDAAERVATWDYGSAGPFGTMLGHFDLLVADRKGEYTPPEKWSKVIQRLDLGVEFDQISATEVRERVAAGETWEYLVPAAIRERVRRIYGR